MISVLFFQTGLIYIYIYIYLKQCVHGTLHIGEKMTMIKNHESHVQSVLEIVKVREADIFLTWSTLCHPQILWSLCLMKYLL